MGKKRKSEKTEEKIPRKIRKLQDQLAAKTVNNDLSPTMENTDYFQPDTPRSEVRYFETPRSYTIQYEEPYVTTSPQPSSSLQRAQSLQSGSSPLVQLDPSQVQPLEEPLPQPSTSGDKQATSVPEQLDEDILQLLGDAPKPKTSLGPAIQKDIAHRWQDVLLKGLTKDVKEKLLKEYLVPSNCDLLLPPSLNLEVKAALPEPLVKRDSSLSYKQNELGIALSALAQVTEIVIYNETSKQKLLRPLSDACRLLCDSHYQETKSRRYFVITSINTKMKNTLNESSRDKFLFGENVSDRLKAAKTIQQSGDALKNAPAARPKPQRPASTNSNRGRLNFLPQHRKTDNKPNGVRRSTNLPPRQSLNTSVGRNSDRSAPSRHQTSHRR